jgi:hypothetical protein
VLAIDYLHRYGRNISRSTPQIKSMGLFAEFRDPEDRIFRASHRRPLLLDFPAASGYQVQTGRVTLV